MNTLELFIDAFRKYKSTKIPDRRSLARAGVAGILKYDDERGICVMLVKRADRDGDPWSGHMAFPGGRMEKTDRNIYKTTTREVMEETGMALVKDARYIGRLSDLMARTHDRKAQMVLTAFVFYLKNRPDWRLKKDELKERIWVPLDFFVDPVNRQEMNYKVGDNNLNLPCYYYDGRRIWGLTLVLIDELVTIYRNALNSLDDVRRVNMQK